MRVTKAKTLAGQIVEEVERTKLELQSMAISFGNYIIPDQDYLDNVLDRVLGDSLELDFKKVSKMSNSYSQATLAIELEDTLKIQKMLPHLNVEKAIAYARLRRAFKRHGEDRQKRFSKKGTI